MRAASGQGEASVVSSSATRTGHAAVHAGPIVTGAVQATECGRTSKALVRLFPAWRFGIGVLAVCGVATSGANATGFYIRAKGAGGVGLATAGDPVRVNDASITFFNPAGMTYWDKPAAQGGIDSHDIDIKVGNRGSTTTTPLTASLPVAVSGSVGHSDDLALVPNFHYLRPLANELWFGLSIATPFGLGTEFERDWFGRYDSVKSELKTINIAPALAWRINPSWSIGGGIDVQYADATLIYALPDPLALGGPSSATDGSARLKGDSWAVGYNVGVLFAAAPNLRLGLHYRSHMKHELDVDATVSGFTGAMGALNGTVSAKSDLRLPDIVSLGVSYEMTPVLTLLAQAQWFGWSRFDEIRVRFSNGAPDTVRPQNFRDTHSLSFGAEYKASQEWIVRAGLRFERSPVQDAFRNTSLPFTDLVWYALGAAYRTSERSQLDLGFAHLSHKAGSIDLTTSFYAGTGLDSAVTVRGAVSTKVNIFSAGVRFYF